MVSFVQLLKKRTKLKTTPDLQEFEGKRNDTKVWLRATCQCQTSSLRWRHKWHVWTQPLPTTLLRGNLAAEEHKVESKADDYHIERFWEKGCSKHAQTRPKACLCCTARQGVKLGKRRPLPKRQTTITGLWSLTTRHYSNAQRHNVN